MSYRREKMSKAVEVKNVTKKYRLYRNEKHKFLGLFLPFIPYRNKTANKNLNFTINKGESVAILGRNGSGKSTILKLITQVIYPTKGEVNVNGRINAILQLSAGFEPEFTGRENIYLKGTINGFSKSQMADYEEEIVEFADIGEYIDQPVRTYSSGMKARLGFAVSMILTPEILIVDEALSVGDDEFKNKCIKKVRETIERDNVTLLLVTHSTKTAQEFCDRGIVLDQGTNVFDGPVAEASAYYRGKVLGLPPVLGAQINKK